MKKILLSVVFVFVFCVSAFCVYADALTPTVTLSQDISAKPGDSVSIDIFVNIPAKTDLQGIQVDFDYSENFPSLDTSRTVVYENTTMWNTVGITRKNLLGVGAISMSGGRISARVAFDIPKDAKGGEGYIFYIAGAVAANESDEISCKIEKNSVYIEVKEDEVQIPQGGGQSSVGGSTQNPASGTEAKPENAQTGLGFRDVLETDWFYESVKFVRNNMLMNGTSRSEFSPDANLTRAMLVTILYRMEDSPKCGEAAFSDVPDGEWYAKAVAWASENAIVQGVGNNEFKPDNSITREQIAVIMYNYSKFKKYNLSKDGDLSKFSDSTVISSWATDALNWAVGIGLIGGKTDAILDPMGNATRAETATILKRFIENN